MTKLAGLIEALKIYKVHGQIKVTNNGAIYVDGSYYGVWDFERKTFTD